VQTINHMVIMEMTLKEGSWEDAMGDLVPDVARWALGAIHSLEYFGVFVLIVSGSLIFPPTELTLPLVGFLVGQGRFSFIPALTAALVARVMASLILYYLGLGTSEVRLRRIVKRIERFRLLFRSDLKEVSELFERHEGEALLVGQVIPGVGAWISLMAGVEGMSLRWRFISYAVLGSTLRIGSLIVLGWTLGREWKAVERYTSIVEYGVLAAVVVGVLWLLYRDHAGEAH
jgi:membrane protein DedA with SNARE-associated domain